MLILIQEYFKSTDARRASEIQNVLKENIQNPNIDQIYLLNEFPADDLPVNPKLHIHITGKRLTFRDAFIFANQISDQGDIVIIANNDISFSLPNDSENNDSFGVIRQVLNRDTAIALSRYELDDSEKKIRPFKNKWSQDTWIFKTPIKIPPDSDFYFGKMFCDSRIAYLLQKEGYQVLNLQDQIKTVHHHLSGIRTYKKDDVVKGEGNFLPPAKLVNNKIVLLPDPDDSDNEKGCYTILYFVLLVLIILIFIS